MAKFYTLLTKVGEALHANAQITQTTVPWTHMAIGDGGGNPVVPKQEQTGLVREVTRVPITSIAPDPNNPNWMVVEAVLPNNVGGWTVRETAIMGTPGGAQCIAVGNYPDTYKPVLAEGSVREMVLRMVVAVIGAGTVNLVIDPAVAIASRGWVESLTANTERRGLVELATQEEAEAAADTVRAVTPKGLSRYMRFKPPLGEGVDLNDVKAFGFYGQPLDANAAGGMNYPIPYAGTLVVQDAGGGIASQIYITYVSGDVWVRTFYELDAPSKWRPWRRVVFGGRRINAGLGLTGGGDLELDREIALALPGTLNGGTANAVTPGGHTHAVSPASESVAGVSMLASQAIAEAGIDTSRPMAALRVLQLIRAAVSNATELLRGVLRVATQTEVIAGVQDDVAVTPLKLANFVNATRNLSTHIVNGSFVVPAGVRKIFVSGCGGGGGGGGAAADANYHGGGGGGGSAGFLFRKAYAVTPGQTLSVVIGAGGSGGTGGSNGGNAAAGNAGGATVIADLGLTLGGGSGGAGTRLGAWGEFGGPGSGGAGGSGEMQGSNGAGGVGNLIAGSGVTIPYGGMGGGSMFGPGGANIGWGWAGAGAPSTSYGGGGSGGQAGTIVAGGGGGIGGKGGNGILVIEW